MIILFGHTTNPRKTKSHSGCNHDGWRIRSAPAETGTHEANEQQKTKTVTK